MIGASAISIAQREAGRGDVHGAVEAAAAYFEMVGLPPKSVQRRCWVAVVGGRVDPRGDGADIPRARVLRRVLQSLKGCSMRRTALRRRKAKGVIRDGRAQR